MWSQSHVDAEGHAVARDVAERSDEAFAQIEKKFMVADPAGARGFSGLGVDEDQIDVGGDIEFATAQLAHSNNNQVLFGTAVFANGVAIGLA